MNQQHWPGIFLGIFIIIAGFLFNPYAANAEELHWGFKKAKMKFLRMQALLLMNY